MENDFPSARADVIMIFTEPLLTYKETFCQQITSKSQQEISLTIAADYATFTRQNTLPL